MLGRIVLYLSAVASVAQAQDRSQSRSMVASQHGRQLALSNDPDLIPRGERRRQSRALRRRCIVTRGEPPPIGGCGAEGDLHAMQLLAS